MKTEKEIDWSQFKKGDEFVLVAAIDLDRRIRVVRARPNRKSHPDFLSAIDVIVRECGADIDDMNGITKVFLAHGPAPGVYDLLCTLTDDATYEDLFEFEVTGFAEHVLPQLVFDLNGVRSTKEENAPKPNESEPLPPGSLKNFTIQW